MNTSQQSYTKNMYASLTRTSIDTLCDITKGWFKLFPRFLGMVWINKLNKKLGMTMWFHIPNSYFLSLQPTTVRKNGKTWGTDTWRKCEWRSKAERKEKISKANGNTGRSWISLPLSRGQEASGWTCVVMATTTMQIMSHAAQKGNTHLRHPSLKPPWAKVTSSHSSLHSSIQCPKKPHRTRWLYCPKCLRAVPTLGGNGDWCLTGRPCRATCPRQSGLWKKMEPACGTSQGTRTNCSCSALCRLWSDSARRDDVRPK